VSPLDKPRVLFPTHKRKAAERKTELIRLRKAKRKGRQRTK
jgi:hypothetical protein